MTSETIRYWFKIHPCRMLALITCLALLPFLGKPFNIDDPLFLWTAKHILVQPGNPYNFTINWDGDDQSMSAVTDNPPLVCYYLAAVGGIFGWSEWAMHGALLVPAILAILGTWRLAGQFCRSPLFAALLTLFTPVFLISADTVMCDVCMLALWIWAVVFWTEGLPNGSVRKLLLAAISISLAEFTKYYGACLLPLLAAYAVALRHPVRRWGQYLILPAFVLFLYQYVSEAVYGESLLLRAVNYSTVYQNYAGTSHLHAVLLCLTFTGGCLAPAVFFAPYLVRKPALILLGAAAVVTTVVLFFYPAFWRGYLAIPIWVRIQMLLWIMAGLGVLLLALANFERHRNASALLLLLWIGGTFVFAAFFNWMINARSLLPMAPAVAILIVQTVERAKPAISNGMRLAFGLAALLAFMACCADFSESVAVRQSVDDVLEKYAQSGGALWFQGHWGFQYYMQDAGAKSMDFQDIHLSPGDHVAVPTGNTNLRSPSPAVARLVDRITVPVPGWLADWNPKMEAGFYAASRGLLPFAFGQVSPEIVDIYEIGPALTTTNSTAK